MKNALEILKQQGATLVDPVEVKSFSQMGNAEEVVLQYELKAEMNVYLARLGPNAPVHTLKEIIEFNQKNKETEMPYFGQDFFVKSEAKGPLTSKEYLAAREKCRRLTRKEEIDAVMKKYRLDALVAPTDGPAWLTDLVNGDHFLGGSSTPAAVAGYPSITVPAGFVFGLPPVFAGRCFSLSAHCTCPALMFSAAVMPSGRVNFDCPSVRNTATFAGCACITDFSPAPYLIRRTRTRSFWNSTL